MILEQVILAIKPGFESECETALTEAKEVISQAAGFRSLTLRRSIERPSIYLLLNEWDTIEDHMVGFRESDLFVRWRGLIGPYFEADPKFNIFNCQSVAFRASERWRSVWH